MNNKLEQEYLAKAEDMYDDGYGDCDKDIGVQWTKDTGQFVDPDSTEDIPVVPTYGLKTACPGDGYKVGYKNDFSGDPVMLASATIEKLKMEDDGTVAYESGAQITVEKTSSKDTSAWLNKFRREIKKMPYEGTTINGTVTEKGDLKVKDNLFELLSE